jgi:hypothetical protein
MNGAKTLSLTTLSTMTFSIRTLSTTTFSITTFSIMGLFVTLDIKDTQQNNTGIMLIVVMLSVAVNLLLC